VPEAHSPWVDGSTCRVEALVIAASIREAGGYRPIDGRPRTLIACTSLPCSAPDASSSVTPVSDPARTIVVAPAPGVVPRTRYLGGLGVRYSVPNRSASGGVREPRLRCPPPDRQLRGGPPELAHPPGSSRGASRADTDARDTRIAPHGELWGGRWRSRSMPAPRPGVTTCPSTSQRPTGSTPRSYRPGTFRGPRGTAAWARPSTPEGAHGRCALAMKVNGEGLVGSNPTLPTTILSTEGPCYRATSPRR